MDPQTCATHRLGRDKRLPNRRNGLKSHNNPAQGMLYENK